MTVDWDNYRPDWPPFEGPLRDLSRKEAKVSFDHFLAQRSIRVGEIQGLLARNGVDLTFDDDSLRAANEWFAINVETREDDPERLRNLWYSVLYDFAVLLGEVIISRNPGLRWDLFVWRKSDLSYHSPVIMGFPGGRNSRMYVNPAAALQTHAYRITHDMPERSDYFVTLVRGASDLMAMR